MAFFTISFLILVQYSSWSQEAHTSAEQLLHQYETLQPFHENISLIMPEEKCINMGKSSKKPKHCWIDTKWEDHSESLEELLQKTENSIDTEDPNFTHTPLGQKYHQLKTFMDLHKKLKSCSTDNSVVNDDILNRVQFNTSLFLEENPDICKPDSFNTESSIALFGSHLQKIADKNIPTESSFEDNLFSQTLKKSVQTYVNFMRQIESENINTQNFKQKLLDKFCLGNTSATSSRGIRNKEVQTCSEKDKEILNNLIELAVKSAHSKELVQHPTKLSHQKQSCYTIRGKKKCTNIHTNIYEFQSIPPKFAEENQLDLLNEPVITADLNYRIANLNSILEDYNDQKRELEEEWALENPNPRQEKHSNLSERRRAEHEHSLKREKFNDELQRLKKTAFLEYKQELALLPANGAGILLQTETIRNKSNFKELEEITAKGLGIFGFEEAELTHIEDFSLLKPIDDLTARLAVQERSQRMGQHITDLLSDQRNKHKIDQEYLDRLQKNPSEKENLKKWYGEQRFERLSKLILSNPQSVSLIMMNNPEHSGVLCEIVDRIEKDQQFKDMLKTGMFLGSAVGTITVGLLTAGIGTPASFATALSLTVGTGLTVADFTLRISEANRHSRNQEYLLNAYLSQTGDHQSIEDIRTEWKSKVKQQFHAGWALALGTFDGFRINSAFKRGVFTRQENSVPTLHIKNNQLQKIIEKSNQYTQSIQDLLQKYPIRSVQRLLRSVKKLPPDQQRTVLDSFSKILEHNSFNLTAFSRELRRSTSKDNISKILKSWLVCYSCRVKVGTKKQKDSSDNNSVIESSSL